MRKKLSAGLVLVAIAIALAATAGAQSSSPIAARSAGASGLPTMTITVDGTSIAVGGALQSGGVDVEVTSTSESPLGPGLIHLNPGVTADQVYALFANPAFDLNDLNPYGQIVLDAQVDKGVSAHIQVTLQPGEYIALDGTRSNPAKRPRASFTVAEAAQPATLPTPQATMRAIDFGFRGPLTLHKGDLVRFENAGFLVHMFVSVQAKNDKDAAQIVRYFKAGKDNKAFPLVIGNGPTFANPLSSKQSQQLTIYGKPGVYVLLCFMGTQDGTVHTRLGMARVFHIAR